MNQQEAEDYIRKKAAEYSVPASEALSLWSQESGRSLNTGLKGSYLPRHNDYARGPFQVVPKFHPNFPVDGTFQQQADYAIPFYASGGPTMEARTRRYYGSGTPMKGEPTLAQYQAGVRSRMTDSPPAVGNVQAPPPQEQTMQYQIEDPEDLLQRTRDAYRPQYQERARYEDPYEGVTYQPREQGFLERWLTNPLTQGGIAMLAANSSDPLANIGYGLQVAGNAYGQRNQADNELLDLQMKRAEARRKAKRETALENRDIDKSNRELYQQEQLLKYADSIEATDPRTAAMIHAGITTGVGVPTSFAPQTYKRGDDYVEVTFDNRGGRTERVLPKGTVPFNADTKTPAFQGAVSEKKAEGKIRGETGAQAIADAPKEILTADQAIASINTALNHPGQRSATGVGSYVPWVRGSEPADYNLVIDQIKGQAFLQAFERLKGGGAITEIEGQKATQAITTLNTSQSTAAHRKALEDLRTIAMAAKERAAKRLPAQEAPAAPARALSDEELINKYRTR